MDIRSELKPWLAQLYVDPPERGRGIGTALVHAAVERSRKLGFDCLIYTRLEHSPLFTDGLAGQCRGKERTVMEIRLNG